MMSLILIDHFCLVALCGHTFTSPADTSVSKAFFLVGGRGEEDFGVIPPREPFYVGVGVSSKTLY